VSSVSLGAHIPGGAYAVVAWFAIRRRPGSQASLLQTPSPPPTFFLDGLHSDPGLRGPHGCALNDSLGSQNVTEIDVLESQDPLPSHFGGGGVPSSSNLSHWINTTPRMKPFPSHRNPGALTPRPAWLPGWPCCREEGFSVRRLTVSLLYMNSTVLKNVCIVCRFTTDLFVNPHSRHCLCKHCLVTPPCCGTWGTDARCCKPAQLGSSGRAWIRAQPLAP